MVVYVGVASVGVGAAGAAGFFQTTQTAAAPLESIARGFGVPGLAEVIALAAVTAMLGVVLNLLLGLSRVLLAMARRGDMPSTLATIDAESGSPVRAVVVTGAVVAVLVLVGDVKTTWSFSAFTVLVYYAITNLAALRLPRERRLFPPWVPAAGLTACLGLAFWVEAGVWLSGLGVIAAGLVWHAIARRR
jgi:APA family basic amino acid/polyamine antiporter